MDSHNWRKAILQERENSNTQRLYTVAVMHGSIHVAVSHVPSGEENIGHYSALLLRRKGSAEARCFWYALVHMRMVWHVASVVSEN